MTNLKTLPFRQNYVWPLFMVVWLVTLVTLALCAMGLMSWAQNGLVKFGLAVAAVWISIYGGHAALVLPLRRQGQSLRDCLR